MAAKPIPLSDRDRLLLEALSQQRLAVVPQAAHWLGVSESTARRRLARLSEAGLIDYRRVFDQGSAMARITEQGLKRIGSSLGKPGMKLDEYRHDVGVGWIWTAAREGAFGEMTEVVSERAMRSHDGRLDRLAFGERLVSDDQLLALDLGLPGSDPRQGRHYPDLLMRSRAGNTIAVELELTMKGRSRLDRVMDAYASDGRIDAVLYVVPDARAAATIRQAAERAGIGEMVKVRRLAPGGIAGVDAAAACRAPSQRMRTARRTRARDVGMSR